MQHKSNKSYLPKFPVLAFCVSIFLCITTQTTQAQEAVPAAQSNLTGVNLPTGAVRVNQQSVPARINQSLENLIALGGGKLRQGDAEVLAWAGDGYKKAKAPSLMNQLQSNLQAKGWTYEIGAKEGEITVFSAVKDNPARRAVLGFYIPTDDALVVAWTEVISASSQPNVATNPAKPAQAEKPVARPTGNVSTLLGTWSTGGMSMMADRNTITGATTPSNSSTFKYVFTPDGRFEFVGMMQSTLYGCTTTLFNDKRGSFEMKGATVTLIPSKNFWRQQNSCAPNSTKERDYTLANETFQFRTKTDEYGKPYICLADAKGETCYRRAENK